MDMIPEWHHLGYETGQTILRVCVGGGGLVEYEYVSVSHFYQFTPRFTRRERGPPVALRGRKLRLARARVHDGRSATTNELQLGGRGGGR